MKKVLIVGCGFAGLSAAQILYGFKKKINVDIIDRKQSFDFLPELPDIIGRGINGKYLSYPIRQLSEKYGFNFINEEVIGIDLDKNEVSTATKILNYDYILIASGSETNFYGDNEIKKYAYKLDDVNDANKIMHFLQGSNIDSYVISGGGYTGIEVATNLRTYLNKKSRKNNIIIIERSPSILGPLPEWMKEYVTENLKRLNIEIIKNSAINKVGEKNISIAGKGELNNSMLIWTAGVKMSDFINSIKAEKKPHGRIKVDEFLRIKDNCFIAGDAALVPHKNNFLRMAVQFSIMEARCAAKNIINSVLKKELVKYKPIDLGYIIPMANNKSCGHVLGVNVRGMKATMLHYIMCVYRTYGLKHKFGMIKDLVKIHL